MVRRKLSSVAATFMCLVAIGLFASRLDANQSAGWGVVVASNAFLAHGGGDAAPVAIGASVVTGDRITTKAGGALVLSRGEDLVTMAENSEIVITDPQPVNATLIDQSAGNVQYHVTKGPAPHFEVDTPLLATVVKGTTFRVAAGPAGSAVSVSEGRVVATDRRSGSSSSVGAGETGSVEPGRSGVSVGASSSNPTDGSAAGSDDASGNASGKGKDSDKSNNGNSGNGGGSSSGNAGGNGNAGGKSNGSSGDNGKGKAKGKN